ncbi:gap junction protein-like [Solea senegalensis]|uniref:Gap junction protein-like n=1 Tax=Solea senegalensis TaxID=28829 RepID=A0AAV6RVG6_SOLSE|nr:gap junction protein-like [Solea senegalensis]
MITEAWQMLVSSHGIFVLGAAADKVWGDEESEFYCDSLEPGCSHACYNWIFPISYVHYWVLQITFVSTPTLVYLGHAIHIIHKEKRMLAQLQGRSNESTLKKPRYTDDRGKVKIKGVLFCTYMTQLMFKILLEVGFGVGQFYIFGSVFMVSYFHCNMSPPCARLTGAQCFISRPTEKTIFIIFMLVVSSVSVLLNIIEIIYLLCNNRRNARKQRGAQQRFLGVEQYPSNPGWEAQSSHYRGFPLSPLPAHSLTHSSTDEKERKEKDT